jgi:biopolymer transport protein ExbD
MGAPVGGGDQDAISDINIVPLVDIILVVLIIFMVTAPASQSSKMDVDLPSSSSGESSGGGDPLQVVMTAEGRMLINGEMVSESGLRSQAMEAVRLDPNTPAIITADKNLPHGEVIKVMDTLKSSGIQKLSVSTTQGLED